MTEPIQLILEYVKQLNDKVDYRLDAIDKNLAEHMRRTDVLEKLHKDNEKRILHLEEPRKALSLLKSVVIYVGTISGTILGLLKLLEYYKG